MEHHALAESRRPSLAELRAALEHLQRRVQRALRVVFVRDRRAEDRHDGIAHEFLDEAVVALDRLRQRLEQRVLEGANLLGIEPLGQRRESGKVGEEDGHPAAVGFTAVRLNDRRRRGRLVRADGGRAPSRAAAGTEGEVGLARGAARGAGGRQPASAARAEREVGRRFEAAAGARHRTEQSKPERSRFVLTTIVR